MSLRSWRRSRLRVTWPAGSACVGSLLTRTVTGRLTDRIGGRAVAVAGVVLIPVMAVAFVDIDPAGRRVPAAGQPTVPAQGQAADPAPAGQAA